MEKNAVFDFLFLLYYLFNIWVSLFKDYLIYDEMAEFLNRFYNKEEIKQRLLLITDYYSHSSRLFPLSLPL